MMFNKNVTVFLFMISTLQLMGSIDKSTQQVIKESASMVGTMVAGSLGAAAASHSAEVVMNVLNDPQALENLQEQATNAAQQGLKLADEQRKKLQEDSGNIFYDAWHSIRTMESPTVSKQETLLRLQNKSLQAKIFREKACTPYYGVGLVSGIVGMTTLGLAPFARDFKTTAQVGLGSLLVSFACYYKTQADVAKLTTQLPTLQAAYTIKRLYFKNPKKFNESLNKAKKKK